MTRVLVTGAAGFIGRAVCEQIGSAKEIDLCAVVRSPVPDARSIVVPDIGPDTVWGKILDGTDVIVHAAARVHEAKGTGADALARYRRVNVAGTMNLARQAADAGVRRFVFLSTLKVNGDRTTRGRPFHAEDQPHPPDAYSRSKHEAEVELQRLAQTRGMEVVVIRPPLVYGPGVRANFLTMMRWVHRGWPLPLGNVDNRRSLVALDNLVDLIRVCCVHPAAANQVFLVSDDEDISITELLRRIGVALQRPARLIPLPSGLARRLAVFADRQRTIARLFGSLQVDIGKTRTLLGWSPVVNMEAALQETARHYLAAHPR